MAITRETIILVAADPALRELARDLLLRAGLSVADASSVEGGVLLEQHYRGGVRPETAAHHASLQSRAPGRFYDEAA
jgi:hypothetical protein